MPLQGKHFAHPRHSEEGKMARFFTWILEQLGALILWVPRAIGGLVAELLREIGLGIGRLIARFLPWAIGAALVLGMIKFMPEVVAPLVGIAACFYAIWLMVRSILPGGRKKK